MVHTAKAPQASWMTTILSTRQLAARDAIARVCESSLSSLELFEEVAQRVRATLSYDWSGWMCTDPGTFLKVGAFIEDVPEKPYRELFDHELTHDDYSKFERIAGSGRRAATLAAETRKDLERSLRYSEIYRPNGLGDELRAVFASRGAVLGVACLVRGRSASYFYDSALAFVEAISESVAEGLRRRLVREPPQPASPAGTGVIVLGPEDQIESITPDGQRLLAEIAPDAGTKLHLPTALYHVVLRVRSRSVFPPRGRVRVPSGRWLEVQASELASADGATGRVVVVLEPARGAWLAPLMFELHCLTQREREVAELLLRGMAVEQIAAELFISRHTVRDHKKAIFAKLGVPSRAELMAKLSGDHGGADCGS
jgi:DNA-binding CsgD family transcriptional regulator